VAAQYGIDLVVRALGGAAISQVAGELKKVDTAAKQAQSNINGAANNIRGFGAASQAAAINAKGLGAAIGAALGPLLSVAAVLKTVKQALDVAFERGTAEQRIKNLTSSSEEYSAAMAIAANASNTFGVSQTEAIKGLGDLYGRLKGVGYGLKETGQIYEGFNVVAKESGLAAADAAGVFYQLSQALGKGKLNGDEFVSVSERMPGLLDAIAAATGRSRGELSQMAQDGKITGDVLYQALAGRAADAEALGNKLTPAQQALQRLSLVSEQLFLRLGKIFTPAVVAGAEALTVVGQKLAEWWEVVAEHVFPKLLKAIQPVVTELQKIWTSIPWDTILGFLQGALLKAFNEIIFVIGNISKVVAAVIGKFRELASSPAMQLLGKALEYVAKALGFSTTEASKLADNLKPVAQSAAEAAGATSKLPPALNDAEQAAKELKKEQDRILDAAKEQAQLGQQLLQAELELAKAKGDTAAAAKIQAELNKQIHSDTSSIIQLEQQQGRINADTANQKQKIADLTLKSARAADAMAKSTNNVAQAASNAKSSFDGALGAIAKNIELLNLWETEWQSILEYQKLQNTNGWEQLNTMKEIAHIQKWRNDNERAITQALHGQNTHMGQIAGRAAEAKNAVIDMKIQLEVSKLKAGEFADELGRAADNADRTARALQRALAGDRGTSHTVRMPMKRFAGITPGNEERFFEGAFAQVNSGKRAIGKDIEKIWPSAGGQGSTAVNINYSGNVLRMNDGDYIQSKDVPGIVSQAVAKTMAQIRNPSSRAGLGMR
jgi:tape measure domain-containing protein